MTKVLLVISGGVLQAVSSNDPDMKIVVIDYDRKPEEESVAYLETPAYIRNFADGFGKSKKSKAEKQALKFCEEVDAQPEPVTEAFGFNTEDVLTRINGEEDDEDYE
jgi:hypothetical protein